MIKIILLLSLSILLIFLFSFYSFSSTLKTKNRCDQKSGIWDQENNVCGYLVYEDNLRLKVLID